MHDPMVVAFEIPAPLPKRNKWRERQDASRWTFGRRRRTNEANLGEPVYHWWRPAGWEPRIAGRCYGLRSFVTVWHVEPKGHDSGTICKHHRKIGTVSPWKLRLSPWLHLHKQRDIPEDPAAGRAWISDSAWKWHFWHWHLQVIPTQNLKRFLFERCAECGRGYPWSYSPIAHQWDGPRTRWFRINRRNYHHECSGLVRQRHTISTDERLIGALFAAFRAQRDLSEVEALALLTDPKGRAMEFGDAYRLTRILGYERDDNYELRRVPARVGVSENSPNTETKP